MESFTHRPISVGSLTKKIVEINPALTTSEIIDLIRQSVFAQVQSELPGEFIQAERIDETKAIRLARATLKPLEPKKE